MPKVLIVDDVAALRQHMTKILNEVVPAVEIIEATNGNLGLEMFRAQKPDLIVMDIMMPELNGMKAAQQIWQENPVQKILFWSQFHRETYVRELIFCILDSVVAPSNCGDDERTG